MGIRILEGTCINEGDDRTRAALYSSVTSRAFGPLFDDAEEAEGFIQWCVDQGLGNGDILDRTTSLVGDFRKRAA